MKRALLLAVLALFGCGTATVNTQLRCPPLTQYTKAQDAKLASEILSAPGSAVFPEYVVGYKRLRDQCAAINTK